ncbi:HipA N-terminal domain-containing protein [Desulfomarina profundi]|uniref:HipA N-terminal domain-containing protein n=1 Tax=Desulfomarina profundi TaxID=2772557 RepID=UPI001E41D77F|nr:HipA N-terminal domain-containing protein [Desulfomarina profundi]
MATGYREIEVFFTQSPKLSSPVGMLAEKDGSIFFEYDQQWLTRGLELSPFTLPLQAGLIRHRDFRFGPVFGLFDDSLPDGWGLLLMDRFFRSRGLIRSRFPYLTGCFILAAEPWVRLRIILRITEKMIPGSPG